MKNLTLIPVCTLLFISFSNFTMKNITYYGGNAGVKIKRKDNSYKYINVVQKEFQEYITMESAKSALLLQISEQIKSEDVITEEIQYVVEELDFTSTSGSAQVKVINPNNEHRIIYAQTDSYTTNTTRLARMRELLRKLEEQKAHNEEFIEMIAFSLN